jgi:methyltransferase (TIGR00027 family)
MKPISKTAFYCCGVRMLDAASEKPVCNDRYAEKFMSEDGRRILEAFEDEASPNSSNVARHRIIDDLLRRELVAHADLRVVIIGAGFDSRAFRLAGGRWLEIDEAAIIEYKNERLPESEAKNDLRRVPIDFSTDSLEEKLAAFADSKGSVVVVIEGVFPYLDEKEIAGLLETLPRVFPSHKLICDLTTRRFAEKHSQKIREKLGALGAAFKFTADEPEKIFIESGYRQAERISIIEKAVDFGLIKMPKILLKTVLRDLAKGYAIYTFEIGQLS